MDAGVVTAYAAPGSEVGVPLVDVDIGDLALDSVELELADEADVVTARRQVSVASPVLVVIVRGLRVVDGSFGGADSVVGLGDAGEPGRPSVM